MKVKDVIENLQKLVDSGKLTGDTEFGGGDDFLVSRETGVVYLGTYREWNLEEEAETFRHVAEGRLPEEFIEEQVQRILRGEVFEQPASDPRL